MDYSTISRWKALFRKHWCWQRKLLQKLFQMVGVSCFLVVVEDYPGFFRHLPTAVDEHVGSCIGRTSVLTNLAGSFISLDYMKPAQFFMQLVYTG